ncbi:23S rRNA (uracil(1939)-C(5))-methyltransferase RlmD [Shewanella surugensis]|uniref:23S rRNA (uracil(1939)-C(5))-methyltransferase RlmD n=1 Tax=Shewanella surugensis TaxID=212020 RepID=A0ABT0L8F3_9GAMM|nr:23S rRNA (uracil(1939)-C(5))-methyltransferase RlmD [Shewanella surugensis]
MAQFFKATPNKKKQLSIKLALEVSQLDHLGAGIAHHQGKIVFIPEALPGESVTVQLTEQKKNFSRAKLIKINQVSTQRVAPRCEHYQHCGGCDLQHLAMSEQRAHKEHALVDLLTRFTGSRVCHPQMKGMTHKEPKLNKGAKASMSKVDLSALPEGLLAASLLDEDWHYRRRARLATGYDSKTKHVSLGFRANSSSQVVEIQSCLVLAKALSILIPLFAKLFNQLNAKKSLGHLELTEADNGVFAVIRITTVLSDKDKLKLITFGEAQNISLLLLDNEGICESLTGRSAPFYALNEDKLHFSAGNFIQVNRTVNQAMVSQAIDWLAPKTGERVLDLFCGVGNFSLPLARSGAEVIGVEGVPEMVKQAQINAQHNGLENVSFYHADLSSDLSKEPWLGKVDKILLDPARAGAYESLKWLKKLQPRALVYVSCNPASLARDSELILQQGYQLKKMGMVDMFPQTHHLESMALFELKC